MKKHLLLLLAALLPVVASAYDAEIGGIYYRFSGSNAVVTHGTYYNSYSGSVVIPASVTYNSKTYSVTSIGIYAFSECSGLTSITIPNSVTSIGGWAFYQCSSLTSVTIPNSVTSIGNWTFSGCSSLTSVTIPNSVTSIGEYAFQGCSSLTSVTIPESVTSIGGYAFIGCTSLTSITIPNSVTSIGDNAFSRCSSLTSVIIGNSVTSIAVYAFNNCSGLTSIKVDTGNQYYDSRDNCNAIIETATNTLIIGCQNTVIPGNVTSIGGSAFSGCIGLTSVTIPESVTSIGEYAFQGCSGLTSVTIGSSVTSIGDWAFQDCRSLTSVIIGNSVTSIADYAFYGCSGLTSITIPNSVTSIGNSAFSGCTGLTSVTIPNSVTSIGHVAFYKCSGLTFVTIPNSVTSIGNNAFYGCSGLKDVYCYAESVPNTNSYAFSNSPIASATLHVPASSVNAYKTTAPWSNFGQIVAIKETCTIPTISYANGKLTFTCETEGAIYHYTITDTDVKSGFGNEVQLGVTYTISVYATKEDYEDSEVATGTLCWIDQQPNTEGIVAEDAVTEVKALPVLIQSNGGTITIQGANEGTEIMVYSVNGMKQGSAIATNGLASINTSLRPGSTAIVKIGDKAVKVLIK